MGRPAPPGAESAGCLPALERTPERPRILRLIESFASGGSSSSRATVSAPRTRTLKTLSSFGTKANARAQEVELSDELMPKVPPRSHTQDALDADYEGALARRTNEFRRLVGQVDQCLNPASCSAKLLSVGAAHTQTAPSQFVEYHRVPLPTRPSQITVEVASVAGPLPQLLASTTTQRPRRKDADSIRGREGKVVYSHFLRAPEEGEDCTVDRRREVPPCKDLFVAVETVGECTYSISVASTDVKVIPTREEALHLKEVTEDKARKRRGGTEARIYEIQTDDKKMEDFYEHLAVVKDARSREYRRRVGNKDMQALNRKAARLPPAERLQAAAATADGRRLHRGALERRRAQLEEEEEARKWRWLDKHDESRRQREEEDQRLREAVERDERHATWLRRLASVVFAERVYRTFRSTVEERAFLELQMQSCRVLQRWLLQRVAFKRRQGLYRNALRLRVAATALARTAGACRRNAAANAIRTTLERAYAKNEKSLCSSVGWQIRAFILRIVRMQRRWRRAYLIRKTYFDYYMAILRPQWIKAEQGLVKFVVQETCHDARTQRRASHKEMPAGSSKSPGGANPSPAPGPGANPSPAPDGAPLSPALDGASRRQPRRAAAVVGTDLMGKLVRMWDKKGASHESLGAVITPPEFTCVRRHAMQSYLREMLDSYRRRLAEWKEQQQELKFEQDVGAFAGSEEDGRGAPLRGGLADKPRQFSADAADLERAAAAAILGFHSGDFRGILEDRKRLLRKYVEGWRSRIGRLALADHGFRSRHATTVSDLADLILLSEPPVDAPG